MAESGIHEFPVETERVLALAGRNLIRPQVLACCLNKIYYCHCHPQVSSGLVCRYRTLGSPGKTLSTSSIELTSLATGSATSRAINFQSVSPPSTSARHPTIFTWEYHLFSIEREKMHSSIVRHPKESYFIPESLRLSCGRPNRSRRCRWDHYLLWPRSEGPRACCSPMSINTHVYHRLWDLTSNDVSKKPTCGRAP